MKTTNRIEPSQKKFLMVLGIGFVVLTLIILSVSFFKAIFPPPIKLTTAKQLSEIISLKMPQHAILLDSEYSRGMSSKVIAKVSVKSSEWKDFKSQKKIDKKWNDDCDLTDNYLVRMRELGWEISGIRESMCVAGVVTLGRADGLWITADLSRKADTLLYIYYQD